MELESETGSARGLSTNRDRRCASGTPRNFFAIDFYFSFFLFFVGARGSLENNSFPLATV